MAALTCMEKYQLEKWVGRKCTLNLLYKATRDGCASHIFHRMCDNQGPTVTVLYNTGNSVFGGFTSQSWDSSPHRFVKDAEAFLYRLRFNGKFMPSKFDIKKNANAIYCSAKYGPTFGGHNDVREDNHNTQRAYYGPPPARKEVFHPLRRTRSRDLLGNAFSINTDSHPIQRTRSRELFGNACSNNTDSHDLVVFSGTVDLKDTYFPVNGSCNYGNSYNMCGETAETINNGYLHLTDIEVYKVKDFIEGQKEYPWREEPNWDEKAGVTVGRVTPPVDIISIVTMNDMKEQVLNYLPYSNLDIPAINILLIGKVGAGKSSFVNTVTSIFRGKLSARALTGCAEHSFTTQFRKYPIKHQEETLNIRLCDTRGLEEDMGLDIQDIYYILDGNVPDRYQLNPAAPISPETPGFKAMPGLADKIHCVAFVMDSSDLDLFSDKVTQKFKQLQSQMNKKGVPQVVYLTKLDKICTVVENDVTDIFRSRATREAVDKAAEIFDLPRAHILPSKNYEKESFVNVNINILVLLALQRMIDFADEFLEEQYDSLESKKK